MYTRNKDNDVCFDYTTVKGKEVSVTLLLSKKRCQVLPVEVEGSDPTPLDTLYISEIADDILATLPELNFDPDNDDEQFFYNFTNVDDSDHDDEDFISAGTTDDFLDEDEDDS